MTPWIWGGLEDEGALQEGVKVLEEEMGAVGILSWEVEEEFYHLLPPPNPASTWHRVTCGGVSGAGAEVRHRRALGVREGTLGTLQM